MRNYRVVIELSTIEEVKNVNDLLEGAFIYNSDFRGIITHERVEQY